MVNGICFMVCVCAISLCIMQCVWQGATHHRMKSEVIWQPHSEVSIGFQRFPSVFSQQIKRTLSNLATIIKHKTNMYGELGELGELGISVCFHLIAAVGGQLCGGPVVCGLSEINIRLFVWDAVRRVVHQVEKPPNTAELYARLCKRNVIYEYEYESEYESEYEYPYLQPKLKLVLRLDSLNKYLRCIWQLPEIVDFVCCIYIHLYNYIAIPLCVCVCV